MIFKRGIFFGILIMTGSLSSLFFLKNKVTPLVLAVALPIGMLQFISSFNYQKRIYKRRALIVCFLLETLYYLFSLYFIQTLSPGFPTRIFGTCIALILIFLTSSAAIKLLKQ